MHSATADGHIAVEIQQARHVFTQTMGIQRQHGATVNVITAQVFKPGIGRYVHVSQ